MNLIESLPASAEANMLKDKALLEALDRPILHLYDWSRPAATFGHFIRPEQHIRLDRLAAHGLELAKRPTGGGIVLHTVDLAFSVLLPAALCSAYTLENYHWVNSRVQRAITALFGPLELLQSEPQPTEDRSRHFCMAKPTIYDLMLGDKKVGGAAQRRTQRGLLHQGSIALTLPPKELLDDLLLDPAVAEGMQQHTFVLLHDPSDIKEVRQALRAHLVTEFSAKLM